MAKVVLISGGKLLSSEFDWIDNYVRSNVGKNVLIIPSFSENDEKWRDIVVERSSKNIDLNFELYNFSRNTDFNKFNIIVVTGRYPDLLLEELLPFKDSLKKWFENSDNLYFGISSGALVLSEKVVITKDEYYSKSKLIEGLGVIKSSVEVHYNETLDSELRKLDLKELYCIEENSALILERENVLDIYQNVYFMENNAKKSEQIKLVKENI